MRCAAARRDRGGRTIGRVSERADRTVGHQAQTLSLSYSQSSVPCDSHKKTHRCFPTLYFLARWTVIELSFAPLEEPVKRASGLLKNKQSQAHQYSEGSAGFQRNSKCCSFSVRRLLDVAVESSFRRSESPAESSCLVTPTPWKGIMSKKSPKIMKQKSGDNVFPAQTISLTDISLPTK